LIKIDDNNFNEQVSQYRRALVCFTAPTCGACGPQKEILRQVEDDLGQPAIFIVDATEAPTIAQRYAIRSLPTLCAFEFGELEQQVVGLQSYDTVKRMMR